MKRNSTVTLGVDLGDSFSAVCVLSGSGDVLERTRVKTTAADFGSWLEGRRAAHVVMEVGTHSPWVSGLAKKAGHQVTVVNPRAFKLISGSRKKNDVGDAELLARAARADLQLLQPVEHRDEQTRADLAVLESRELVMSESTRLTNRLCGVLKSHGVRITKGGKTGFEARCRTAIPSWLAPALEPLLVMLRTVTEQIAAYDKAIAQLEKKYSEPLGLLRQVPRVGPLTALAYRLIIGDPKRFAQSRTVGAYVGLVPRQKQSGDRDPQLGITKAGHPLLRKLLIQVVHLLVRPSAPDTDLKRWVLKKAARGGKIGKKKAVVAGARKLAVLLHHLWLTGEVYEPLRSTKAEAR